MGKRLLIIQPSYYLSPENRRVYKTRRRTVTPLVLPYLAALTPADWQVTLLDEQLADIDFGLPVDLVALSVWTLHAYRAYDIAARFRARGVKVIMGGPHVFFYPDEALEHCDAIGIGEAETIWTRMLDDAASGRLQPKYREMPLADLKGLPIPRYDLLNGNSYGGLFGTVTVQSSRGCPFHCSFCSEKLYLGGGYRWRPAEEVAQEIKASQGRNIFFGESNFAGKRARAMELMEALIPLRIRWSTLWSTQQCLDTEFLDLAKKSGVLHVNIGMESIDPEILSGMNKKMNKTSRYDEMCKNLKERGISYSLNFIFGWDGETKQIFQSTLDFVNRNKVPAAYFNIFNPAKGTQLFEDLVQEGRVVDPDEIDRWPGKRCHFIPRYCTPQEMEDSVGELYKNFYKMRSILSRLPFPKSQADMASWFINLSERRLAYAAKDNNDFDGY